jgi:hypothetical protein
VICAREGTDPRVRIARRGPARKRTGDASQAGQSRADCREAPAGGSRAVQGPQTAQVCNKFGIAEQADDRGQRDDGESSVDQARQPKDLEDTNTRLKRLIAKQADDVSILKQAASGND